MLDPIFSFVDLIIELSNDITTYLAKPKSSEILDCCTSCERFRVATTACPCRVAPAYGAAPPRQPQGIVATQACRPMMIIQ